MNTDKVLALAKEAHGPITGQWFDMDIAALTRFAALIQQQMEADGWRQCAVGQGTTQFCGMAEHALRAAEDLRIELSEQL